MKPCRSDVPIRSPGRRHSTVREVAKKWPSSAVRSQSRLNRFLTASHFPCLNNFKKLGNLTKEGKLNDKLQADINAEYEKQGREIRKRLN